MRLSRLAALGFMLVAFSAGAQEAKAQQHMFGSRTCHQTVPCSNNSNVSSEQWAGFADACMMEAYVSKTPGGYFDDMAGLDDAGCLTAKTDASSGTSKTSILPKCCVIKTPASTCVVHCDIIQ